MGSETGSKKVLKVFVASPGDVPQEREKAREILAALARHHRYGKSFAIEPYLWDDPENPTPMSYLDTPEDSILEYGEPPGHCDLLIAILKHRLGSPLPESYGTNADGEPYTGTEWEIQDAVDNPGTGTEEVFVFVSQEPLTLPRGLGRAAGDALYAQSQKVEDFLRRLKEKDGSYRGGVNDYKDIDDFAKLLRNAVERWLDRRLDAGPKTETRRRPTPKPRQHSGAEATTLTFKLDVSGGDVHTRLVTPCDSPRAAVLTAKRGLLDPVRRADPEVLIETLLGTEPMRCLRDIAGGCLGENAPGPVEDLALRFRIVTRDADLALLPWHRIARGRPGWAAEAIYAADAEHIPVLEIPIENPLLLAPADATLEIGAVRQVSEVQEGLRALVGGRGASVTWARTRRELEHHLRHDPPDLLYVYSLLDRHGRLLLGRNLDDGDTLTLLELADLLAHTDGRPLLWIDLIVPRQAPALWQPLLPHCRLLLGRQSESIHSETAAAADLALLDRLQDGVRDLPALVSAAADPGLALVQPEARIKLSFPGAEPGGELAQRARIRTELLRLLLGREPEKNMLHGYVTGAADGDLLVYVAVGDDKACVHDFPAQVRHRLEQDLRDGIRVITRYVTATPGPAATATRDIQRLFKQHLMPAGGPLDEALEHLVRDPPLEDEKLVISLPWLLDLPDGMTPPALADWIAIWADFHARALADSVPDGCRVLLGACLRTAPECGAPASDLLRDANDALGRLETGAGAPVEPVRLNDPLGRLLLDHLQRFYAPGRYGRRLVPDTIDSRRLAEWIVEETAGAFADAVDLIYREYKDGYTRFQQQKRRKS